MNFHQINGELTAALGNGLNAAAKSWEGNMEKRAIEKERVRSIEAEYWKDLANNWGERLVGMTNAYNTTANALQNASNALIENKISIKSLQDESAAKEVEIYFFKKKAEASEKLLEDHKKYVNLLLRRIDRVENALYRASGNTYALNKLRDVMVQELDSLKNKETLETINPEKRMEIMDEAWKWYSKNVEIERVPRSTEDEEAIMKEKIRMEREGKMLQKI